MESSTCVDKLDSEKATSGCCPRPLNGATGQLTEEEESGCMTGYSPHIFMLPIHQHEKAFQGLTVGELLLLYQTTEHKKAWESVLPPHNSPKENKYALSWWYMLPWPSFGEENAQVIKVNTTSFHYFFIIKVLWSFQNQLPSWPERETLKKKWKIASENSGALCIVGFCFDLSPA